MEFLFAMQQAVASTAAEVYEGSFIVAIMLVFGALALAVGISEMLSDDTSFFLFFGGVIVAVGFFGLSICMTFDTIEVFIQQVST